MIDDTSSKSSTSTVANTNKLFNEKKYLLHSLKPYNQLNNYQSPIEQQQYRSRLNLIMILISLFVLIGITIGVYHILKYFINEKKQMIIIIKTTSVPNEKTSLLQSENKVD